MKIATSLTVLSLINLALGAPDSTDDNDKLTVTKSLFADSLVLYTGQHEIVNLLLPINGLNLEEDEEDEDGEEEQASKQSTFDFMANETDIYFFFIEADIDSDGKRVDRGLYMRGNGRVSMLLEDGRDAAASFDTSKLVFFAASDGIYFYDVDKYTVARYGTIKDSIIGIAKEATGDVIYILTENHEVYKVSNEGTTKEKLDNIVNAKQIVVDYFNNIYFYSDDKQAYVRLADGVKKIEGLPENPNSVKLIRPPFILDNAVLFLVDDKLYTIYANGTSEQLGIDFNSDAIPSAFSVEPFLFQMYAYDKKIYQYNVTAILSGDILEPIRGYVTKALNKIGPVALREKVRIRNQ